MQLMTVHMYTYIIENRTNISETIDIASVHRAFRWVENVEELLFACICMLTKEGNSRITMNLYEEHSSLNTFYFIRYMNKHFFFSIYFVFKSPVKYKKWNNPFCAQWNWSFDWVRNKKCHLFCFLVFHFIR